jgi:hypothetical protein
MHTRRGVTHRTPGDAVLVLAGAGSLLAARLITPAQSVSGPVLCPFRLLTGIPCPACGLTRSWVHTAHGQWDDAFALHAFGPALMLLAAVTTVVVAVHWATGRWWIPPRAMGATLVVISVAMGVWWVARGVTVGWAG